MDSSKRRCTPGLRAYQWMMKVDRQARLLNQDQLRALPCDRLFCSHDAVEFKAIVDQSSAQNYKVHQ